MVYCKRLFFVFIILLVFFNTFCFAYDNESVEIADNLLILPDTNYFVERSDRVCFYKKLEKNKKYKVVFNPNVAQAGVFYFRVVKCNNVPAPDVPFSIINYYQVTLNSTMDNDNIEFEYFNYNDDDVYMVFSPSGSGAGYVNNNVYNYLSLSSETIDNQVVSINGLVDSVGPNVLWGVFGSGIDFVFVVVVVAFGIFIIVKLIKGLSKGKSKI